MDNINGYKTLCFSKNGEIIVTKAIKTHFIVFEFLRNLAYSCSLAKTSKLKETNVPEDNDSDKPMNTAARKAKTSFPLKEK